MDPFNEYEYKLLDRKMKVIESIKYYKLALMLRNPNLPVGIRLHIMELVDRKDDESAVKLYQHCLDEGYELDFIEPPYNSVKTTQEGDTWKTEINMNSDDYKLTLKKKIMEV